MGTGRGYCERQNARPEIVESANGMSGGTARTSINCTAPGKINNIIDYSKRRKIKKSYNLKELKNGIHW